MTHEPIADVRTTLYLARAFRRHFEELTADDKPQQRQRLDATADPDGRRALRAHHSGKRRAARLQRMPAWADQQRIQAIYAEARAITAATGIEHHVDHFYPLQGKFVSGLHVHQNLQILTGAENARKHNCFEP